MIPLRFQQRRHQRRQMMPLEPLRDPVADLPAGPLRQVRRAGLQPGQPLPHRRSRPQIAARSHRQQRRRRPVAAGKHGPHPLLGVVAGDAAHREKRAEREQHVGIERTPRDLRQPLDRPRMLRPARQIPPVGIRPGDRAERNRRPRLQRQRHQVPHLHGLAHRPDLVGPARQRLGPLVAIGVPQQCQQSLPATHAREVRQLLPPDQRGLRRKRALLLLPGASRANQPHRHSVILPGTGARLSREPNFQCQETLQEIESFLETSLSVRH